MARRSRGGDPHRPEVRTQRHDDTVECRLARDAAGRDDRSGFVDQRRRAPVEAEHRPAEHRLEVELVDRHPLLAEVLVQMTPVAGEVGAIRQPRERIEDVDLEHIARPGAGDRDRAGQEVRAGAPVLHLGEYPLDACVHQQIGCVAGMVRERLDRYEVAALDGQDRLERAVEVTPVHCLRCRGKMVKHHLTPCSTNARQPP